MQNSDTLEFRSRTGFAKLFGAMMAGLGIFFVALCGSIVRDFQGPTTPRVILLFMISGGVFLILAGLACLVMSRRTVVCAESRTITICWRVFSWSVGRRELRIPDHSTVLLNCYAGSSPGRGGGGGPEFHVSLLMADDHPSAAALTSDEGDEITLTTCRNMTAARRAAESIARALGADMVDRSDPSPKRRKASELDRPLVDRLRESPGSLKWPGTQGKGRIQAEQIESGVRFALPRLQRRDVLLNLASLCILMLLVGGSLYGALRTLPWVLWVAACAVAMTALTGLAIWYLTARETLTVSRQTLRLETRQLIGRRVQSVPTIELEELDHVSDEIRARSDRLELKFADRLTRGERRWLVAAIRFVLSNGRMP